MGHVRRDYSGLAVCGSSFDCRSDCSFDACHLIGAGDIVHEDVGVRSRDFERRSPVLESVQESVETSGRRLYRDRVVAEVREVRVAGRVVEAEVGSHCSVGGRMTWCYCL